MNLFFWVVKIAILILLVVLIFIVFFGMTEKVEVRTEVQKKEQVVINERGTFEIVRRY